MLEKASSPSSLSIWAMKPWWCQPWSTILTGLTLPTLAWLVSHRLWVVTSISFGILGWWFIFLYVVPKSYAESSNTEQTPKNTSKK